MKQLITLAAALVLAISTSAFATSHKEAPGMAASGPMAGGAMSNCDAKAAEKKLAGAAKTSFVKKCEADSGASVTAACDAKATEKKLAGAAKTSFVKKCETDAPSTMAACDAKAAEKKLAGAAKTSFTKKCMADA